MHTVVVNKQTQQSLPGQEEAKQKGLNLEAYVLPSTPTVWHLQACLLPPRSHSSAAGSPVKEVTAKDPEEPRGCHCWITDSWFSQESLHPSCIQPSLVGHCSFTL